MKSIFTAKYYCLFLFVLLFSSSLMAQQAKERITIRGRVIDKTDKSAIINGSVVERDKDMRYISGQATNIDGNFAIKISNPKNLISFSYMGYKTLILPINGQTVFTIELESLSKELGEIVITGKGVTNNGTGLNIDARSSTIATSTLKAEEVQDLGATSIDQALAGRLSGVDVGTTTGDPGAGMSIRIRGTSTLSADANPMIVVDGMPYETQIPSDFNFGTADEQGYAQLLNIAPSDIKDITVLKDAASTAVWGSRAANGVLIINTKRGMVAKPSITYNVKGSFSKQPTAIPLLSGDQYSTLIPEMVMNRDGLPLDVSKNFEFSYDPNDPAHYYNYSRNSDWIGAITKLGYSQDHNISMDGGGEKARYRASIGYVNQTGTTVGTTLNRITSRINLDYNVSSRITIRTDVSYAHVVTDFNYQANIRGTAYTKMPNMSIFQYDEYGNPTSNYFSPAANIQGQYIDPKNGTYNPLAMALVGINHQIGERITPKFQIQYQLIPNLLKATFDVQIDINNNKTQTFLPQLATGRPSTETYVNKATDGDGDGFSIVTKSNLIYTPKLKEGHDFTGLLSASTTDNRNVFHNVGTSNTASDVLQDPSVPSRTQSGSSSLAAGISKYRSASLLLSGQYGYLDRYLIRLDVRTDGNSNIGPKYRFGVYPAVSTRWRISGEPFMKRAKFLDELSLRASIGISGNEPNGGYYNLYQPFGTTYLGMSGVYPSNMELTKLRSEQLIGTNVGIDLAMLKNRIKITAEAYRNVTNEMFMKDLQISSFTGFDKVNMNIGSMDNVGWEINLNTVPLRTKNWAVNFDFTIANNINTLLSVSEFYPLSDNTKVDGNGKYKTFLQIGNPTGSFYGFRYKGVYRDADATIARDASGTQIIGPN